MLTCKNCPTSWTCFASPIALPPRTIVFNIHDAPKNFSCQVDKHVRGYELATFQSAQFNQRPLLHIPLRTMLGNGRSYLPSKWDWRLAGVVLPLSKRYAMDSLGIKQELAHHPFLICTEDSSFLLNDFVVELPDRHFETQVSRELSFLVISGDRWSTMKASSFKWPI